MLDFTSFDDEFEPTSPFDGDSAEILPDGNYEFIIRSASIKEIKSKGCLEMKLEVVSEGEFQGRIVNNLIWVSDIDGAKRCGFLLKGFGFDTDLWKKEHGRSFSVEFPKSIRWLHGMRVKAAKKTSVVPPKHSRDTEKVYHNINFRGRSEADDGLPKKIGPEQLNQPDPEAEQDPFAA